MVVAFIGSKQLCAGFGLIGIKTYPIEDVNEAVKKVERVIKEGTFDMLIITEDVYMEVGTERLSKWSESKARPVIAVIPTIEGAVGKRLEDIYNLISQAVGVRLELGRE
jgi:vacuolar-type H+-ATPase subunit F/Vma7